MTDKNTRALHCVPDDVPVDVPEPDAAEPAAFDYLVRCSSASNIKLRLVARVLVDLAAGNRPCLRWMRARPA
jgi:hypothetical protein